MKKSGIVIFVIFCLLICTSCAKDEPEESREAATLMETSDENWVKEVKKDCGITGFGRPLGTVRETLEEKKGRWKITFDIDEEITQEVVDGYARAVWEACEKTNQGRLHNSGGYLYDDTEEARRRQEPLDYYIWYYHFGKKEFRAGVYSTNMEDGIPGGIVLKIERWNN